MKKILFLCLTLVGISCAMEDECIQQEALIGNNFSMKIEPIKLNQVSAVRQIILEAVVEHQIVPIATIAELDAWITTIDGLADVENFQEHYFNNRGIFLVLLYGDTVVGMGGIKYFTDTECELKRMFFRPAYRGRGLGKMLAASLLDHAHQLGYSKIYLEIFNPATQGAALALYKKLGFYEIAPYQESYAKLWMEKKLN